MNVIHAGAHEGVLAPGMNDNVPDDITQFDETLRIVWPSRALAAEHVLHDLKGALMVFKRAATSVQLFEQ
jgi:hypothetical protein